MDAIIRGVLAVREPPSQPPSQIERRLLNDSIVDSVTSASEETNEIKGLDESVQFGKNNRVLTDFCAYDAETLEKVPLEWVNGSEKRRMVVFGTLVPKPSEERFDLISETDYEALDCETPADFSGLKPPAQEEICSKAKKLFDKIRYNDECALTPPPGKRTKAAFSREDAHYLAREEYKKTVFPMETSSFETRIISLGTIVTPRDDPKFWRSYHDRDYVFPVGFKSVISACVPSPLDPTPGVFVDWSCEVVRGADRPIFVVHPVETALPYYESSKSADDAWEQVFADLQKAQTSVGMTTLSYKRERGEKLFGLTDPKVLEVVEGMDGMLECSKYVFKTTPEKSRKATRPRLKRDENEPPSSRFSSTKNPYLKSRNETLDDLHSLMETPISFESLKETGFDSCVNALRKVDDPYVCMFAIKLKDVWKQKLTSKAFENVDIDVSNLKESLKRLNVFLTNAEEPLGLNPKEVHPFRGLVALDNSRDLILEAYSLNSTFSESPKVGKRRGRFTERACALVRLGNAFLKDFSGSRYELRLPLAYRPFFKSDDELSSTQIDPVCVEAFCPPKSLDRTYGCDKLWERVSRNRPGLSKKAVLDSLGAATADDFARRPPRPFWDVSELTMQLKASLEKNPKPKVEKRWDEDERKDKLMFKASQATPPSTRWARMVLPDVREAQFSTKGIVLRTESDPEKAYVVYGSGALAAPSRRYRDTFVPTYRCFEALKAVWTFKDFGSAMLESCVCFDEDQPGSPLKLRPVVERYPCPGTALLKIHKRDERVDFLERFDGDLYGSLVPEDFLKIGAEGDDAFAKLLRETASRFVDRRVEQAVRFELERMRVEEIVSNETKQKTSRAREDVEFKKFEAERRRAFMRAETFQVESSTLKEDSLLTNAPKLSPAPRALTLDPSDVDGKALFRLLKAKNENVEKLALKLTSADSSVVKASKKNESFSDSGEFLNVDAKKGSDDYFALIKIWRGVFQLKPLFTYYAKPWPFSECESDFSLFRQKFAKGDLDVMFQVILAGLCEMEGWGLKSFGSFEAQTAKRRGTLDIIKELFAQASTSALQKTKTNWLRNNIGTAAYDSDLTWPLPPAQILKSRALWQTSVLGCLKRYTLENPTIVVSDEDAQDPDSVFVKMHNAHALDTVGVCDDVLCGLMETPEAKFFEAPVDLEAHPTYIYQVSRPLDLGTIRKRLHDGWYDPSDQTPRYELFDALPFVYTDEVYLSTLYTNAEDCSLDYPMEVVRDTLKPHFPVYDFDVRGDHRAFQTPVEKLLKSEFAASALPEGSLRCLNCAACEDSKPCLRYVHDVRRLRARWRLEERATSDDLENTEFSIPCHKKSTRGASHFEFEYRSAMERLDQRFYEYDCRGAGHEGFAADVRQVVRNCLIYHVKGSAKIVSAAHALERKFNRLYAKLVVARDKRYHVDRDERIARMNQFAQRPEVLNSNDSLEALTERFSRIEDFHLLSQSDKLKITDFLVETALGKCAAILMSVDKGVEASKRAETRLAELLEASRKVQTRLDAFKEAEPPQEPTASATASATAPPQAVPLEIQKDRSLRNKLQRKIKDNRKLIRSLDPRFSFLGKDRFRNVYFAFDDLMLKFGALFVFNPFAETFGFFDDSSTLNAFIKTLDERGVRESKLKASLTEMAPRFRDGVSNSKRRISEAISKVPKFESEFKQAQTRVLSLTANLRNAETNLKNIQKKFDEDSVSLKFKIEKTKLEIAKNPRELLPNWQETKDPATGKPYFWNTVTKQTSWERPLAPKPKTKSSSLPHPRTVELETAKASVANAVQAKKAADRHRSQIKKEHAANKRIIESSDRLALLWCQSDSPLMEAEIEKVTSDRELRLNSLKRVGFGDRVSELVVRMLSVDAICAGTDEDAKKRRGIRMAQHVCYLGETKNQRSGAFVESLDEIKAWQGRLRWVAVESYKVRFEDESDESYYKWLSSQSTNARSQTPERSVSRMTDAAAGDDNDDDDQESSGVLKPEAIIELLKDQLSQLYSRFVNPNLNSRLTHMMWSLIKQEWRFKRGVRVRGGSVGGLSLLLDHLCKLLQIWFEPRASQVDNRGVVHFQIEQKIAEEVNRYVLKDRRVVRSASRARATSTSPRAAKRRKKTK